MPMLVFMLFLEAVVVDAAAAVVVVTVIADVVVVANAVVHPVIVDTHC